MRHTLYASVLIPLVTGACATHAVEHHYGEALAQMKRAQTYDVRAGDDSAVLGMDPVQQMRALGVMRRDVSDRTEVKAAPLINISQQTGSGGGSQ